MMSNLRDMHRVFAVLMIALWGVVGVVAPAHAAEEDLHHTTQHDVSESSAATGDAPLDENSVHPEHATHCHSGACHFHAMSRGAADQASITLTANRLSPPRSETIRQTNATAIFHPPRV